MDSSNVYLSWTSLAHKFMCRYTYRASVRQNALKFFFMFICHLLTSDITCCLEVSYLQSINMKLCTISLSWYIQQNFAVNHLQNVFIKFSIKWMMEWSIWHNHRLRNIDCTLEFYYIPRKLHTYMYTAAIQPWTCLQILVPASKKQKNSQTRKLRT